MENNSIILNGTRIWLGDDGIMRSVMEADGVKDALTNEQETVLAIGKVCKGKKRPFLVDLRMIETMDERKNHCSDSSKDIPLISAMAMLIPSLLSRDIGSYFLGSHKPKFPVRPFTDESKAKSWLKKFLK